MSRAKTPLLEVSQWQTTWDLRKWEGIEVPKTFYIGSISIKTLRKLSGVRRRDVEARKQESESAGHQRAHDEKRSEKINRFIKYGYPLSRETSLNPNEHTDLINPGWLPTSIIINIIPEKENREIAGVQKQVTEENLVKVINEGGNLYFEYPEQANKNEWDLDTDALEPLEIIDGQHRLFAIDGENELDDDYNVPVVIFDGLNPHLQAYLFWVINVEPVKINPSLAFDLYPELRSEKWLEQGEAIQVYREHRAQELTEALWRHPDSPWSGRIEIHGKRIEGHVSNAAFIRSLQSSFIRQWGNENKIGGLFGSIDKHGDDYVLPWKRSQQAAFLILIWIKVLNAIKNSNSDWVKACIDDNNKYESKPEQNPANLHPAFAGPYTLIATDQGVRALLVVFNALCQCKTEDIGLDKWYSKVVTEPTNEAVTQALTELNEHQDILNFIEKIADAVVNGRQDWRTSKAPSIQKTELRNKQGTYRGSSGYKELISDTFKSLSNASDSEVAEAAKNVSEIMGIEK